MARIGLIAALLMVAFMATPPGSTAGAQDMDEGLTLRHKITVDDAFVRLGDLFEEPLDDPDIPIAEAPSPGQSMVLESRRLRHVAEAYGLNWRPVSKLQRVEVTRASQRITPERIEAAVQEAVAAVAHSGADLRISLDRELAGFDLPTDVDASLDLRELDFDPISRRFTAILVAPADGPALITHPVAGSVVELAQIPVPRRLISAGETIGTEDMDWIWIEADRLSAFHLTDIAQVIGQVAKRPLKAGQPMRSTDVAQTPLIKKNNLVRLIVTSGPMTLSARGRALEDGAFGQAVRVINVDSNRQVSGVVRDSGTVTVGADIPAAIN